MAASTSIPSTSDQASPAFRLVHPEDYARRGYPHDEWTRLRAEEPVSWQTQAGDATDYWAITKHADITEIGKRPDAFLNGPRLVVQHVAEVEEGRMPPTLIQMDPPMHGEFRQMISWGWCPTGRATTWSSTASGADSRAGGKST